MRCRVIINGYHGTIGDLVDYQGDPDHLPPSLVAVETDPNADEIADIPEQPDFEEPAAGAEDLRRAALRKVLEKLEHDDDSHWTDSGKPKVGVVNTIALSMGVDDTNRAELRNLLPDMVRRTEG